MVPRFLSLGGITFQPSEFVKILFLFFLAGALWENVFLPESRSDGDHCGSPMW